MKYLYLFILVFTTILIAGEFEIVNDVTQLTNDITAQKYGYKDVNGEWCSILKVNTNIKDLQFEGMGYEKNDYLGEGIYLVYLQPGSKYIKFKKDGFIPKNHNFPTKLESNMVYMIELKGIEDKIEEITVTVQTNPSGAEIYFDDMNKGFVEQIKTNVGQHKILIKRSGYKDKESFIQVSPTNNIFVIDLEPISQVNSSNNLLDKSTDIKEWELLGLTRDEYIDYKKKDLSISDYRILKDNDYNYAIFNQYKNKLRSPIAGAIKSLLFAGWGQNSVDSDNAKLHLGIEGGGLILSSTLIILWVSDGGGNEGALLPMTSLIAVYCFNIYSSIDAIIETNKYNNTVKQKYKLSLSPSFNPQNNRIGVGFSVNF